MQSYFNESTCNTTDPSRYFNRHRNTSKQELHASFRKEL